MLERLGECGMVQQAMNQGQDGFYLEEPEVGSWWPERDLGMASAREEYEGRVEQQGLDLWLPSPATDCLGLSGPALRTEQPVLVASQGEEGILRGLCPSACRNEHSEERECGRGRVGGDWHSLCPRASPWPGL